MNLNNMKVSTRLSVGFGAVLALLLVVLLVGLLRMKGIADAMELTVSNRLPKLETMQGIMSLARDNARLARDIILLTDPKDIAAAKAAYDNNREANSKNYESLEKSVTHPQGIALLKEVEADRKAYLGYIKGVIDLGMANKNDEATKLLYGPQAKTQDTFFEALTKLVDFQRGLVHEDAKHAIDSYESARTLMVGVGVIALVVGVALALLITRGIAKDLGGEPGEAAELAQAVAQGDLSRHIHVRAGDTTSLMANLKAMSDSLTQVVARVRQGSEGVSTASSEIAQGNHDLSGRTESQASALEETAASMEELSSTVKQNADNARQANQLAVQASTVATKGGEVVGQVVHTMKGISEASNKIADIISVIDGIAFQTNILALNAAVEAARAGEQGRGFAVVAAEVRSLASRSAEAAKEIKSLITASVERVEQGSNQVDQAGATMSEVVASIQRVADIMGEISAATSEQAQGVSQVGEAVTQMDQVTQQNAALVEEMAAAASSLKTQAQDLVGTVSVFRIGHDVALRPAAAAPTAPAHADATVHKLPVRRDAAKRPALAERRAIAPLAAKPALAVANGGSAGDDWASF